MSLAGGAKRQLIARLLVSLRDPRAATAVAMVLFPVGLHGQVLRGSVLDARTAAPVSGAVVALTDSAGRLAIEAVAGDGGEFHVSAFGVGAFHLTVRRLGYQPFSTRVQLGKDQVLTRDFYLTSVTQLDTVSVRASAVIPSFEDHRAIGLGHFITRAELEKLGPRRLSEVLSQVRGVRVIGGTGNKAWIASSRGPRSLDEGCAELEGGVGMGSKACTCYAQVYLDDVPLYAGRGRGVVPNINAFFLSGIEAVEYYAGPSQTPLKYSRMDSKCGVLVMWTRRSP